MLVDGIETDLEIIDHPACEMSVSSFFTLTGHRIPTNQPMTPFDGYSCILLYVWLCGVGNCQHCIVELPLNGVELSRSSSHLSEFLDAGDDVDGDLQS